MQKDRRKDMRTEGRPDVRMDLRTSRRTDSWTADRRLRTEGHKDGKERRTERQRARRQNRRLDELPKEMTGRRMEGQQNECLTRTSRQQSANMLAPFNHYYKTFAQEEFNSTLLWTQLSVRWKKCVSLISRCFALSFRIALLKFGVYDCDYKKNPRVLILQAPKARSREC